MLDKEPPVHTPERLNLKKKEEDALGRIPNIYEMFMNLVKGSCNKDAWILLESKALALHQEIMEIKAVVSPWDSEDQMEQAGDVLVCLLGYMDNIEHKIVDPKDAIAAVQNAFESYQERFKNSSLR